MNRTGFLNGSIALAAAPVVARAQTPSVGDAIARLFTAPAIDPAWFDGTFRAAVPIDELRAIVAGIVTQLGPYRGIVPNGAGYTITFERGTVQGSGTLNARGAFSGLLFSRMQSHAAADRLTAVFTADTIPADWFSSRFLTNVPIDRIRAITAQIRKNYGTLGAVRPQPDGTYDLAFAKSDAIATIFLGGSGQVEGLIIRPHGTPPEDD